MIKTVMFDLGGVLVRTEDIEPRKKLAQKYQLTYNQLSDIIYRSESGLKAMVGEITTAEHWDNIHEDIGLLDGSIEAFEKAFWGGDVLDRRLIRFLEGLRSDYQIALLSNAWDNLRHLMKDLWEIDQIFDEIFISAEIGFAKPDPAVYNHVLKVLKREPEEVIFVDDFPENIAAARKIGIHAIHFKNRDQALAEVQQLLDADQQLTEKARGL